MAIYQSNDYTLIQIKEKDLIENFKQTLNKI